jgi:DNA modification methylase
MEDTPQQYVATMVELFREVKRVLRPDGTLWLNIGDTYSYGGRGRGGTGSKQSTNRGTVGLQPLKTTNVPPKNLLGIPWRLAFALQDDGWIIRSDIIWHKPNPMPESVKDRPTSSYEHVFLISKNPDYYYDADAIREEPSGRTDVTTFGKVPDRKDSDRGYQKDGLTGANSRNVWRIQPRPSKGAHFATMPVELAERCIKAGTSEHGCCSACGAPFARLQKRRNAEGREAIVAANCRFARDADGQHLSGDNRYEGQPAEVGNFGGHHVIQTEHIGWQATCDCNAGVKPCVVLDPFGGAGTTGLAAKELGRDYLLIELNPDYVKIAEDRLGLSEVHLP